MLEALSLQQKLVIRNRNLKSSCVLIIVRNWKLRSFSSTTLRYISTRNVTLVGSVRL